MGEIRAFSKRARWSPTEEDLLSKTYHALPRWELAALFPHRDIRNVQCKANMMGLVRPKKPKRSQEAYLAAKREGMARQRQRDPEGMRQKQKEWCERNREHVREKNRSYMDRRFFWAKTMRLDGPDAATHIDLARRWKAQRGRCALTGRRLDRSAEIDHRHPKSKGGVDAIGNLQWVCREANRAKGNLTEEEFFDLCASVCLFRESAA